MCDNKATSKEHVPPKCFFPETKDLKGSEDYRKNLITVPSCEVHNSQKSTDDSYLLAVITAHYENGPLAKEHYSTKIKRALKKDEGLKRIIVQNSQYKNIGDEKHFVISTDHNRIIKQFERMGYALYYHEKNEHWDGQISALTPNIYWEDSDINSTLQEVADHGDKGLNHMEKFGQNEEVFYYRRYFVDNPKGGIMELVFFKGFEVWLHLH
ncbi:hypothetical protein LX73_1234 [Fodinibius salinus]|uniref:Uncharacterized protein n=1 Tax=Fodinibius salinus TaxID=860790 RepID=A0A5D3YJ45_9BACT|nr:hypothetical protein [Fodinibius salinus]TYP93528.1 hypothetical protein LX73_1234 [Fodinibius salinus]